MLVTPFLRLAGQSAATGAPAAQVGTLSVVFAGPANVSEQVVRANMQTQEGSPFDQAQLDRDIRSLYRTGLFEFIEFKRQPGADSKINLVVEVTPKFRVSAVAYLGNKKVKTRRLEKETQTKINSAIDERQIKEDADKIRRYYQKSGYNQAVIDYTIERNPKTGFGTVTFKIEEGYKVHISDIDFTGNEHASSRKLRKQMATKEWGWFSWLTSSGRFKDDDFQADLDKLRDYYRDLGYLDVQIDPANLRMEYPSKKKLHITISVVEGRRYNVGEVSITGNKLYTTEELMAVIKQKTGSIFAPTLIDKDRAALEEYYGKDGYLDARARLSRKPNLQTGAIDIEYSMTESEKFYVESIRIEGNTKTKSVVILRELNLGPGDVFNITRMNISKMRLENTRFFENPVNVTPESTNLPGRKNLKISVKEGRTGNVTFGAGFSSLDSVVVFTELTQSNFDLFNRKSLFQGDGQKFRLRLQLGARSSEAILSFEEPWLFERELALGFSIYRTSTSYSNQVYDEVRTGVEVYLRKRLIELVEGRLSYTLENVKISDVDTTAPNFLKALPPDQTISKLGLQLLRDTRDRLINTSRGNRAEFITEVAGGPFGFDASYYRFEIRGAQYIPTFELQNQVLSLIGRTGIIDAYGDSSQVPYFDRFFLGGPSTLRGFGYREVGPKDNTGGTSFEPTGGGTYGFFSAEYTMDIVEPIRFAVFYDAGFVNVDAYDFDPSRYNDNFGVGLRIQIAGAPLSLDFGIPITSDATNDDGLQFNFSFGTRF